MNTIIREWKLLFSSQVKCGLLAFLLWLAGVCAQRAHVGIIRHV
jgi:hypothetical protein